MNDKSGKILIVDDEEMNCDLATTVLEAVGHETYTATNGQEALDRLNNIQPDVILLDVMMPVMDGFTALEHIRSNEKTSKTPVIILTALNDKESIRKGLEIGANDYLTKPYDIGEFRLRVENMLNIKRYNDLMAQTNSILEEKVAERTAELQVAYLTAKDNELGIVEVLGRAAEFRDNETGAHIQRMSRYSALLAKSLGFSEEETELILYASAMHDVGKIGIGDTILLKAGKLTAEEFDIMKTHPQIGYDILTVKDTPLTKMAAEIALTHHEKIDGTGYPRGLKGEQIPINGRIVAIADVFDALTSERPYKKALDINESILILKDGSGTHFDPRILQIFIDNIEEVLAIKEKYANN